MAMPVPIHRVRPRDRSAAVPVDLVRDDLVPAHVPVGPPHVGPPPLKPEHLAVEVPRDLDVVHGNREVEWSQGRLRC
jgi:hypothetical protein